jgi:hypothetical protein
MVFDLALDKIRTKRASIIEEDAQALDAPIAVGGAENLSFSTTGSDMSLGIGVDMGTLGHMMVEEHMLEEETAMAETDDYILPGGVAPLPRSGGESPNLRAQWEMQVALQASCSADAMDEARGTADKEIIKKALLLLDGEYNQVRMSMEADGFGTRCHEFDVILMKLAASCSKT